MEDLRRGSMGVEVQEAQYYLAVLNAFYEEIPAVIIDGVFGTQTEEAVDAFQKLSGLPVTGVIDVVTWNYLSRAYYGIVATIPQLEGGAPVYPGELLRLGSQGEDVMQVQEFINYIAQTFPEIPQVPVNGVFGNQTQAAVLAFQRMEGIEESGAVGAITWTALATLYSDLMMGYQKQMDQFPGAELSEEGV